MAKTIRSYRELTVWQEGMELAEACYRLTQAFPREEAYGLTAQIRRAAASIPANIAEGYGRGSRKTYMQFLFVAQGSLKETETHLLLAERVGAAPPGSTAELLERCDRLGRRMTSLIRSLRTS